MNHFQLFLNASTQTIFIVYASLSVLHVSHVSTFLQCRQHSRGRADSRSTIEKKILSLLPGEHPRKGTGIPRAQLISCTRRSSCLLWRWCSDPAISILVLKSLRCRYESAPTCAVGYFRCRLSASSTQSYIQTEVCLLVQPDSTQDPALLQGKVNGSGGQTALVQPGCCITQLSPELSVPKGSLHLPKFLCTFLIPVTGIFLLAFRRYNKSWAYRTHREGILQNVIPSCCSSIIHLPFGHHWTQTIVQIFLKEHNLNRNWQTTIHGNLITEP